MTTIAVLAFILFIYFFCWPKVLGEQIGEIIFHCRKRIQELDQPGDEWDHL